LTLCSATQFIIYAGTPGPSNSSGWLIQQYFPSNLVVEPGDTVIFVVQGSANHTITFVPPSMDYNPGLFKFNTSNGSLNSLQLNPLAIPTSSNGVIILENVTQPVSSGILIPTQNWTVQINSPIGSILPYFCLLHPLMRGFIYINQIRENISSVNMDVQNHVSSIDNTLNVLTVTKALMNNHASWRSGAISPSRIWTVSMIGERELNITSSYVRFIPSNLTISLGDTVEFVNDDIISHIVAFNTSYEDIPPYLVEDELNPLYLSPSNNSDNYIGGFATSGLLQPVFLQLPYEFPSFWRIQFTIPGTYPYICSIHSNLGMIGSISVTSSPYWMLQ